MRRCYWPNSLDEINDGANRGCEQDKIAAFDRCLRFGNRNINSADLFGAFEDRWPVTADHASFKAALLDCQAEGAADESCTDNRDLAKVRHLILKQSSVRRQARSYAVPASICGTAPGRETVRHRKAPFPGQDGPRSAMRRIQPPPPRG